MRRERNDQAIEKARERYIICQDSRVLSLLLDILIILRWRGTLETAEDVARHNAAEEVLALFSDTEDGNGNSKEQVEYQLRAAITRFEQFDKEGHEADARRNFAG